MSDCTRHVMRPASLQKKIKSFLVFANSGLAIVVTGRRPLMELKARLRGAVYDVVTLVIGAFQIKFLLPGLMGKTMSLPSCRVATNVPSMHVLLVQVEVLDGESVG